MMGRSMISWVATPCSETVFCGFLRPLGMVECSDWQEWRMSVAKTASDGTHRFDIRVYYEDRWEYNGFLFYSIKLVI